MAGNENPDENGGGSSAPGIPPVIRTIVYLLGALGFVVLLVDATPDPIDTAAKIAVGLAAILGFTYNPSFGVGSKK